MAAVIEWMRELMAKNEITRNDAVQTLCVEFGITQKQAEEQLG